MASSVLLLHKRIFKEYIDHYTTLKTRQRSVDVVVSNLEITEDKISATVKGTEKYSIEIKFNDQKVRNAICTCPFDQGPVCKHIVRVLVEADDQIFNDSNKPLDYQGQSNSSLNLIQKSVHPFEFRIGNFQLIHVTTEFLFRRGWMGTSFGSRNHVLVNNIERNNGTFEVISHPFRGAISVVFDEENKELCLTCKCDSMKSNLCLHQLEVLNFIKNHDDFHPFFDREKRELLFKENAVNYGLENEENLDQFFDLSFEMYDGVRIVPKKEGLIPTTSSFYSSFAKKLGITKQNISTPISNVLGRLLVFKVDRYLSNFQVFLCESPLSQAGKPKNPIVSIPTQELVLEGRNAEEIKFYAGLHYLANYRHDSQLDKELKAMQELLKNPLNLPFYRHLEAKSDNITSTSITPIAIQFSRINFSLSVVVENDFYEISSELYVNDILIPITHVKMTFQFFLVENEIYHFLSNPQEIQLINYFRNSGRKISVHASKFEEFQAKILQGLERKVKINYTYLKKPSAKQVQEIGQNSDVEKIIYLAEEENFILITPVFRYKSKEIPILSPVPLIGTDPTSGEHLLFDRDTFSEEKMLAVLLRQHSDFESQLGMDSFYVSKREFLDEHWFLEAIQVWRDENYTILGFNSIKNNRYNLNRAKVSVQVQSGIDWFNTKIDVKFGEQTVSLKELQKAAKNKTRFVQLGDGSQGILPEEWLEKFIVYYRTGEVTKEGVRTAKSNFTQIDNWYSDAELDQHVIREIAELRQKIVDFKSIQQVQVPNELNATLRDYQKEGLNWLNFLDEFNFGGCLADDMGLGKTVQILAFLLLQRKRKGENTNLVVLPTSLIFNWQQEIKKFAPSLKVKVVYGNDRVKTAADFAKYEVIITSYGTLLSDIHYLKDFRFNYIVLDESQAIKNPDSQRYKSVRLLQSRNKIVMTGTPIENNTFDLFAQLSFANPGLLGTKQQFRDEYSTPIDRFKDFGRAQELQNRINPFVLRRTKAQVATELPEKTEMILYCEMGEEQRKVYDAYKAEMRAYLQASSGQKKFMDTMYMLAALTKLRQICNSPALLNEDEFYGDESAKIAVLMEEIESKYRTNKILVFSQFVGMLSLIERELNQREINYTLLTGQSKNREEIVTDFKNNSETRVFLISLKAGGTGLNLTEADYVYLVDPWWNPAVENQAIDRCYRIGQEKHVMAIRLITPGTIEEKIMELQASKKDLASDLVRTDQSILKSLSPKDLMRLLD